MHHLSGGLYSNFGAKFTDGDANMLFIFQQDNAPVHRASNVEAWLDANDIQVIQ